MKQPPPAYHAAVAADQPPRPPRCHAAGVAVINLRHLVSLRVGGFGRKAGIRVGL